MCQQRRNVWRCAWLLSPALYARFEPTGARRASPERRRVISLLLRTGIKYKGPIAVGRPQ
jgi:hypothetical protein